MSTNTPSSFSVPECRKIVKDLLSPNPWIYWCDLIVTLAIAFTSAAIFMNATLFSTTMVICYIITGVAFFRAALFMHEVVHFRRGDMTSFKIGWNILAGVPMVMPSFLYESHMVHHNTHHYGTVNDGEYLPLGIGRLRSILRYLLQILLLPIFVAFRFLVLGPISFLHPRLRRWVLEHASSFVINFSYRREIPDDAPRKLWATMEVACFLRLLAMVIVVTTGVVGWERIPRMYSVALMALGLNHIRTLVAHRYMSRGEHMSHAEQFEDSVNIAGFRWLNAWMFPVGLRYHALHHLIPSIPYHNLGTAHRRLRKQLPADSPYHQVNYPSFRFAVMQLLKSVWEAGKSPPPAAEAWYARQSRELQPTSTKRELLSDRLADLGMAAKARLGGQKHYAE